MGQFLIFETKMMCHIILYIYIYHNSTSSNWVASSHRDSDPLSILGCTHSLPPGPSAVHAWQGKTGSKRWQDLPQFLNPPGLRQPSFREPTP